MKVGDQRVLADSITDYSIIDYSRFDPNHKCQYFTIVPKAPQGAKASGSEADIPLQAGIPPLLLCYASTVRY